MINLRQMLLAGAAVLMLASCSSTKDNNNLAYFKQLPASGVLAGSNDYADIRIVPDDELIITISSEVAAATSMFNPPLGNPAMRGTSSATGQQRLLTYIVDRQGNIEIPSLGMFHVEGKTIAETQEMIKAKVSEKVKDPFVRVEHVGYGIDVMGEVKVPQRITVQKERYTLLDAIAAAGDLTEYARRDNVLVIRDINGQRTYNRVNLQDTAIFNSPYYYLRQNDVVYVEPNAIKVDNSKVNQNTSFQLSKVSTIVSLSSVVASLVIALLVK